MGAWIRNDKLNEINIFHGPSTRHTLWLQMITETRKGKYETIYITITYSNPNNTTQHKNVLAKLKTESAKLSKYEIHHMGDFNSRIKKLTGDHRNNPYGTILRNKMLNNFKIHTPTQHTPTNTPLSGKH